ncbi:MAG: protein kinase [Gemmataceae bacterium]|nr:protein kinase [Gemmataceae bacterium]
MQVLCNQCRRTLEYLAERPSFCSYCGAPLTGAKTPTPADHDPDAPTVLPSTLSVVPPAQPAVPERLGDYRLLRQLGAGGMGTVYEAEEIGTGRRVAVKVISASFAASADAVERFRQEGLIASMLTHPRCVFVIKTDNDGGWPYIVMELMEGSSLKDLVERRGPLPPEEAIAKILDVIEGLQAAHRLEIIHRDVKPSNCFLESDGRVKVGDFGLAKSLVKEAHLTKTGAFVGTPHFASPEQVRGENIQQQTDVYSVAATLFYLLTGKPPFWGSDPTATLARIVSDPLPSLRSLNPKVPLALERVVRRGLERDLARRYANLEELRQALLHVKPGPLTQTGLLKRTAAFVLDAGLIWLVGQLALAVMASFVPSRLANLIDQLVLAGSFIAYFTITEASAGASLGKALLRLRVTALSWMEPPGWGAVLVRSLVCYGFWGLGAVLAAVGQWTGQLSDETAGIAGWLWSAVGAAAMCTPMRARNQWRGLHELVSGTRVAHATRPPPRQALSGSGGWLLSFLGGRRMRPAMPAGAALPESIAGFTVRGALSWTERDKVLLGEDVSLGRRVFLWLRGTTAAPLDAARRSIGRRTRLRWLACGRQGDWQWDAILAPQGCPLPELIHSEGVLEWSEARVLLEDLARELAAACADGTLPHVLSPALVWVQTDGRAQLADVALTSESEDSQITGGADEQRALLLLRQVVALALDGRKIRPHEPPAALQADLPDDARACLMRLMAGEAGYRRVADFAEALARVEAEE